ncbi:unnamed protein product, partial [Oppiella nova]
MDKFLFLKYSLIFVQILTLISFTLYLSHVFEESLDNHKALEPNIDDYIDDNQLWESRMDGLVVFGFLLFLYCVITFGVYSVIEEKIGRILAMDENDCAICLDGLNEGTKESNMQLICDHQFHKQCIKLWFDTKSNCPVCRTQTNPITEEIRWSLDAMRSTLE